MSDMSQGPGWWQASDGKWYPPEQAPGGPPPPYSASGGHAAQHGGAPPGGGAPPPGQLAEWGQRAVAFLIDWAILVVALIVVLIVSAVFFAISDVLGILVQTIGYLIVAAGGFYFYYLNGSTGQSPGKRLTGLKVIGEATGQPIGGGLGIVRGIAHFLDSIICYIGWLFPLWDEKRQTIADKVMHTVVITGVPKQELGPDVLKP